MKALSTLILSATGILLGACSGATEDAGSMEPGGEQAATESGSCTLAEAAPGHVLNDYAEGCPESDLCVWDKPAFASFRSEERVTRGYCASRNDVSKRAFAVADAHLKKLGLGPVRPEPVAIAFFGADDHKSQAKYLQGSAFRLVFAEATSTGARYLVSVYLKLDLSTEQVFVATNPQRLQDSAEAGDNFACLVSAWKCGLTSEQADSKCPRLAGAKAMTCEEARK